jgi:hypothetical protein
VIGGGGPCPFFSIYQGICLTAEGKLGNNQCSVKTSSASTLVYDSLGGTFIYDGFYV